MTDWRRLACQLRQEWPSVVRRIERRWPEHFTTDEIEQLKYRCERWSTYSPLLDAIATPRAQPPDLHTLYVDAATKHRNAKIAHKEHA